MYEYMNEIGVEHIKGVPYWPQSNGEVENHNKTLLKMAKCAKIESKQFQDELSKYLFAYRSTPHCTTGVSPAELLMGRRLRTKLPCILDTDEFVECEHFADNSALKSNAMNRDEIHNLATTS